MSDIIRVDGDVDVFRLGEIFARSGYFQDANDAAKATVKILAGRELGLPPFASMTGIHIIKGKPTLGANLIAARIKASGKYNYRVIEMSDTVCRIAFFEKGEQIGISEFTIAEARRAGTQNLDKFPKNMLFARAIANGAKWYTPDLFVSGVYMEEPMEEPEGTTPSLAQDTRKHKMLKRIAELGGDVLYAESLSEDEIIAYGKNLRDHLESSATGSQEAIVYASASDGEVVEEQ